MYFSAVVTLFFRILLHLLIFCPFSVKINRTKSCTFQSAELNRLLVWSCFFQENVFYDVTEYVIVIDI